MDFLGHNNFLIKRDLEVRDSETNLICVSKNWVHDEQNLEDSFNFEKKNQENDKFTFFLS